MTTAVFLITTFFLTDPAEALDSPDAKTEPSEQTVFSTGTWELFGTAQLSAGNGTEIRIDSGAGYFWTPEHQFGLELEITNNGIDDFLVAPFYRFHFYGFKEELVLYGGGLAGLYFVEIPGHGGPNAQDDSSDTYLVLQGMGGMKLMISPSWSVLVQLAIRHYVNSDLDPFVNVFSGFSVYF